MVLFAYGNLTNDNYIYNTVSDMKHWIFTKIVKNNYIVLDIWD